MSTDLHILNARGLFSPALRARVERAFSASLSRVAALLPVHDVNVVVYIDRDYVIPRLGISGFCTAPDRLYIPIDPENPAFNDTFEQEFLSFLGHELHHCVRRTIDGFAHTVGQALITEGLACCFESELRPGHVPFYAQALAPSELLRVSELALRELNLPHDGWDDWFFGACEPELPHHAGYSVGYSIVSRYLASAEKSASALWAEPASTFIAATEHITGTRHPDGQV